MSTINDVHVSIDKSNAHTVLVENVDAVIQTGSSDQSNLPNLPIKDFNSQINPGGQIQYIPVMVNQSSTATSRGPQPVDIQSTFEKGGKPGETVHIYVNTDIQDKILGNWAIPMAAVLEEDPTSGAIKTQLSKKHRIPAKDKVLPLTSSLLHLQNFLPYWLASIVTWPQVCLPTCTKFYRWPGTVETGHFSTCKFAHTSNMV